MFRKSMEIFDKIYASENIKDISKIVELVLNVHMLEHYGNENITTYLLQQARVIYQ